MHKTNLFYSGRQKFLRDLIVMEMLRQEDDGMKYLIAEKGREFVKRYAELQDLLK